MIYEALKEPLLAALRAPSEPPKAPLGAPDSVEIFQASPRFLTLELSIHFGAMALALALELLGFALAPGSGAARVYGFVSFAVVVLTVGATLLRYFLIRLEYDLRFYVLTDRSLRIRRGALAIEESTYTFANVQNLVLRQGPLERLFGLAHLELDTAGGVSSTGGEAQKSPYHRGRLEGLELSSAAALRDRILHAVSRYGDTGLGDRSPGQRPLRGGANEAAELVALEAIARALGRINVEHKRREAATDSATAP